MKRLSFSACVIAVCLLCATRLGAQQSNAGPAPAPSASVPRLIKLSGVLNDLAGKPLSGPVEAVFSVYQNESDAEPLWQETQTVQADTTGRYTVLLGAMSEQGLPVELFTSGEARWLGVAAGKLPEQPRVLLVSVPYALEAGDAATLGGKPASAYLLSQSGVGATVVVPQAGGATAGAPSQTSPAATTPTPRTVGDGSAGSQNYVAKWTDSSNDLGNSLLFDNGTNVGIGTTTPGTLNGTSFPSVLFQTSQSSANSYLAADTSLAGGYAGLLLNLGGAGANNRLWAIENQPVAGNSSSRLAFSTYTDAGASTPVLTMLRTGNVGIGTSTPGTLNGTYFPSLLLQAAQSTASTYLTADTESLVGYAGLLLNRGAATANSRLWAVENEPTPGYTSSQFAISAYSDAGMPTPLLTILRSGKVGIGTTTPGATLEVNGTALFDNAVTFSQGVTFSQPVTFASGTTITGSGAAFIGSTSPVISATNTSWDSYGQLGTNYDGNAAGVLGGTSNAVADATGVEGLATAATGETYGVVGTSASDSGTGVAGGASGAGLVYGVLGSVPSSMTDGSAGVAGWASGPLGLVYGVQGSTNSTTPGAAGVTGSGLYGIAGYSTSNGGVGVYGSATGVGIGTYSVYARGNLGASGTKSAVVALPDNRVVELYAMESPENWFEDFGSGQLRDGVSEVTLDPTFALAVNTGTGYHVFLTPNGDCEGLYVAQKTATGFQVRELRGGRSNITFDYRIVAKRRGYEDVRMDQLETDAATVQAIREVVQNRPTHRSLILPKQVEAPTMARQLHMVGVSPAARALAAPRPLEPSKMVAVPEPPQK